MAMTLITTNTESGDATSDFTSGIDSTYKLYIFKFYDVNPATDDAEFGVQFNVAGQSGYNETITSTFFSAYLSEGGSGATIGYQAAQDQAQGTALQVLGFNIGHGADERCAGELFLFNPSNTTYVKHFYARTVGYNGNNEAVDMYCSGYINVTGAIDEVQFKMSTGNMDGVIRMYGVA